MVTVESLSIGGSSRASKLACWSTTLQRCLGGKSDRQRAAHLHGAVLKSELTEATARRDLTQGVNSGSSCHPHVQLCCDEASSGARPSGSLGCTGKSAASSQACPCGSATTASHKGLCRCVCLSTAARVECSSTAHILEHCLRASELSSCCLHQHQFSHLSLCYACVSCLRIVQTPHLPHASM